MTAPLEITSTDTYRITYHHTGSDVTFIVFHGIRGDIDTKPFGLDFLLKNQFNVIGCANRLGTHYQGLSFTQFQSLVSPFVQGKRVILYGSSLGGYCALYYAGAVGGTVLAASPRNSAHPALPRHERFNPFRHAPDFSDNLLTDGRIHILHDPANAHDKTFLTDVILPSYPQASVYPFAHVGHRNMLKHLSKAGVLKGLIRSIADNDEQATTQILSRQYRTPYSQLARARFHWAQLEQHLEHAGTTGSLPPRPCRKVRHHHKQALKTIQRMHSCLLELAADEFKEIKELHDKLRQLDRTLSNRSALIKHYLPEWIRQPLKNAIHKTRALL